MGLLTSEVLFQFGKQNRPGYLAQPESTVPLPGIVVIHEILGLNEQIRDVTRRLANEGYAAVAVDLFSGRRRAMCMARYMAANLIGKLDYSGIQELKSALTFLCSQPGVDSQRLGAIGFCMGGGFAITWACTDQRLKVIAPFYGLNPRPLKVVARACPVVGSYPGLDFTAKSGRALDVALDHFDIPHDIKIYPNTRHAFFNDQIPRVYDAQASADAWQRTLAFFQEHLKDQKG